MIRVVTFDFWQTLVVDTPENLEQAKRLRVRGVGSVLARAGRAATEEALEAAYDACGQAMNDRFWAAHRDLPYREQVKVFLELVHPGVTSALSPALFDEAVLAYINAVLDLPPRLVAGVGETLTTLRRRGVLLGIISNTGRTPGVILRRVLDRYALLQHFAAISYSDEVGFRKPHPEIFKATLGRLGADPAGALHIGDDAVADVIGARKAGMRAAHFVPAGGGGAPEADFVLHDLAALPDRLARVS